MVRLLIIVSVASFVLCVACFAIVSAIGGPDLARHNWRWDWSDDNWDRDRDHRRYSRAAWSGPVTTRDIAFTGATEVEINVPADVTYTQAPQGSLKITGPREIVERIEVHDGEISLPGYHGWGRNRGGRLQIVMTGPDTRAFSVRGSQTLTILNYQQDELNIDMPGSGKVTASGAADRADIDIAGSGEVDLRSLALNHVDIDIAGSGDVTVGPRESANIDIAGSGDVTLTTQPPQLTTDIAGSGDIRTSLGSTTSSPPSPSPSPSPPAQPSPAPAPPAKPAAAPAPAPAAK